MARPDRETTLAPKTLHDIARSDIILNFNKSNEMGVLSLGSPDADATVVEPYVPNIRRYREVPTNRDGGEEFAGVCMGLRHALTLYAMFSSTGTFLDIILGGEACGFVCVSVFQI